MPKARAPRHSRRSSVVKIVAAGVGGVLGILVGLGMAGTAVARWSERTDYLAARACIDTVSGPCVTRVPALVLDKRAYRGRSDSYVVRVRVYRTSLPDSDTKVTLPVPDDVWPRLRRGDQVTVVLWGRDVAAVEAGGVRAETEGSPAIEPVVYAVYGPCVVILGLLGVLYALGARDRAVPVLVPFGVAAFATAFTMEPFDVYDPAALLSVFVFVGAGLAALVGIPRLLRR